MPSTTELVESCVHRLYCMNHKISDYVKLSISATVTYSVFTLNEQCPCHPQMTKQSTNKKQFPNKET